MDENDLKGHLERLSTRGTPRGAANVLEAAQSGAAVRPLPSIRRYAPVLAIAASVALIGGVAAAIAINRGDSGPQFAARPVPTGPASSTTEAPVPEVSIPAKLIAQSRLVPFSGCGPLPPYMRAEAPRAGAPHRLPPPAGGGGAARRAGPRNHPAA